MANSNLAPGFLIAMPQLLDRNFQRAVVLLVHHDRDGTFGVVLNRPTDIDLPSLCASLEIEWRGDPHGAIDWGGPVQPQSGWMLFREDCGIEASGDVEALGDGIQFAGSLDVLRQIAMNPTADVRLLLGYAGWGPGQLESELIEGAWITAPLTSEVVFRIPPVDMWEHVVRSLGIDPSTLVATSGIH